VDSSQAAAIESLASLADPHRRRLYAFVRAARRPVSREEAAVAIDISRKLAAFHLDKLVASGLLRVSSAPPRLPRAVGRAPKRYEPVTETVSVSLPGRRHDELATILVLAADADNDLGSTAAGRRRVARDRGRRLGAAASTTDRRGRLGPPRALDLVESVLVGAGYEPYRSRPDRLRLASCPFHPVAVCAPEVVCTINVDLLGGLLDGLGVTSLVVTLDVVPGECCVEIHSPA
jgi:predicted ArsR family transcriptional regulator